MNLQEDNRTFDNNINKRIIILDIYKGILIILVVFRHVLQYSVADEGGILTNFVWAIQMPGFMFVSGYFSARVIQNTKDAIKRFLISAQYYLLPFLSWFVFIDVLLRGKYDRNPLFGLQKIFTQIDVGLWFIWVVFVLSIIATLMNLALSSRHGIIKACFILFACFGVLCFLARLFGVSFLGIKFILYYSVFYLFGYFLKNTEVKWKKIIPSVKNVMTFLCLFVFLAIIFNFDLYHNDDDIVGIIIRIIAGFTGNVVLLAVCVKHEHLLTKIRIDKLGLYSLEIYVTHVYVNNLIGKSNNFFSVAGLLNFVCSFLLTLLFTTIIIATFKSIPWANYLFYGKKNR